MPEEQSGPAVQIGGKPAGLVKRAYERVLKIRGNPHEIALGFALGLFVGMSPALGLHTAIAVFLAALFKWNKISAAIAVWISNPFTAPFLYSMTYVAGAGILGVNHTVQRPPGIEEITFYSMLMKAPEIFWALILGGVVLGLPVAVAGYFFSYSAVQKYRDDIRKKLAARKKRRAEKRRESTRTSTRGPR